MPRFIPKLSVPSALAGAAVVLVLSTGTAYAASQITSSDIKNNTIKSVDVRNNTLTGTDIKSNSVTSSDIVNKTLTGVDVKDGSLTGADVKDGSLSGADVKDGTLSNADVGVFFAQVNSDGTLANSSGGVTSSRLGTGVYQVAFDHDISTCASVVTQGEATPGGASGAITGATERAGNPKALFITLRTDTGALADKALQLVVAC